jgi:DNA-binding MarR family transcriptional regulator
MFLYRTQPIRDKHGVNWHEELLLGAVEALGETWTNDVIDSVRSTMSSNTAHKYITQLVDKGYLKQTRSTKDKRFANVDLTQKAVDYLTKIQEAIWTKEN